VVDAFSKIRNDTTVLPPAVEMWAFSTYNYSRAALDEAPLKTPDIREHLKSCYTITKTLYLLAALLFIHPKDHSPLSSRRVLVRGTSQH